MNKWANQEKKYTAERAEPLRFAIIYEIRNNCVDTFKDFIFIAAQRFIWTDHEILECKPMRSNAKLKENTHTK